MTEAQFQKGVAKYLDYLGATWCHVPNSRKTPSRKVGGFWVGQGVKAGVPDCIVFDPRKGFNGLALELKIKPNKPSKRQVEWLYKLQKAGWATYVVYDIDSAIEVIDWYLNAGGSFPPPMPQYAAKKG